MPWSLCIFEGRDCNVFGMPFQTFQHLTCVVNEGSPQVDSLSLLYLVVALQRFNVPTLPFLHPAVRVGPPLLCALTRSANLGLELLVQWLATSILSNTTTGRLILGVIRDQFNAQLFSSNAGLLFSIPCGIRLGTIRDITEFFQNVRTQIYSPFLQELIGLLVLDISLQRYCRVLTPLASFLVQRVLGSALVRTIIFYPVSHYFLSVGGEDTIAIAFCVLPIYSCKFLLFTFAVYMLHVSTS